MKALKPTKTSKILLYQMRMGVYLYNAMQLPVNTNNIT